MFPITVRLVYYDGTSALVEMPADDYIVLRDEIRRGVTELKQATVVTS